MLATHRDAERRYEILRKEAVEAATETIKAQGVNNIIVQTINSDALNAAKVWGQSEERRVSWDWLEGYSYFKFRYPKRFEMAIWETQKLIGLSLGRPTYEASSLRLDFVEASPLDLGERPAIIEYVLLGYDIYARMINAKQIRIMNPVNKTVLAYYEKFGYEYYARGDFLYRSIF